MDYRELLIKYIKHVTDCEGVNYINDNAFKHQSSLGIYFFTDEEKIELEKLSKE
jgi:hypothetical protein